MRRRGLLIAIVVLAALAAAVGWALRVEGRGTDNVEGPPADAGITSSADGAEKPSAKRARAASRATAGDGDAVGDADPGDQLPPTTEEEESPDDRLVEVPLSFTVVADDYGRPVAGAIVHVYLSWKAAESVEGRTDVAGKVALVARAPQFASLDAQVRAEGFVTCHVDVKGVAPEVRLVRGAPLSGRVVLADTGAPVAGAEVFAWDVETRKELDFDPLRWEMVDAAGMLADAGGRFRLAGLPPRHAVVVAARTEGLGVATAHIEPGEAPAELVLRLGEGGGTIEGRVTSDDGSPAADAKVWAAEPGEDHQVTFPDSRWMESRGHARFLAFATTAADGTYRLRGLPTPGRYQPVATGPEHARAIGPVADLRAHGDAAKRDLALVTPASIAGTAFAPNGDAADVANYGVLQLDGSNYDDPRFNSSGLSRGNEFHVDGRAPGAYLLFVRPKGPWQTARIPVTLSAGERKEVEVRFETGVRIAGQVIDDTGAPVAGAWVSTWVGAPGARFGPSAETDAQGAFVLEGLPDGEQSILAASRRGFWAQAEVRVRPGAEPVRIVLRSLPTVTATLAPLDGVEDSVRVLVRVADETRMYWVERDETGRIRIPFVPEGTRFAVTILPGDGFVPIVRSRLVVAAGETRDLGVLRVERGFVVEGTILDADGAPAAGAEVSAWDGSTSVSDTTDAAGRFRLERLPEETEQLTIRLAAHAALRATATSGAATTIRCERGVAVTVVLVADDGGAVLPRELRLDPVDEAGNSDWSRPWERASSDSRGAASVRLLPGAWEVWARGRAETPGGPVRPDSRLGTIRVAAEGPTRFELRLPPE